MARIGEGPPPAGGATVAEALGASGLEPAVREAIIARLEVSCGYGADDLDAGALAEGAAAFGDFDTHTVQGGNDRIARGLATRARRCGSAVCAGVEGVVARRWRDGRRRWVGGGRRRRRDRRSGVGGRCDRLRPAAPARERGGPLRPGREAVRCPEPSGAAEPDAVRAGALLVLHAVGSGWRSGAVRGCVRGLARSARDARGSAWARPVVGVAAATSPRPRASTPTGAVLSTWADDRWVRGAYSARSARLPIDTEALRRPVGPLFFAGEHTAGAWHGLMEGALRSGERAAQELLQSSSR